MGENNLLLTIVRDSGNGPLRIEGDSLVNGDIFVGEGIDFRPIHCTELREKLKEKGWLNEGFKIYYENRIKDPNTNVEVIIRTYKYKLPSDTINYTISDNYIDDGLPIINTSTESLGSPDIMITKSELEQISSGVTNTFNEIFGEQKGERELKINRSTRNQVDIVENSKTIIAIDSSSTSIYTNTIDLNDLVNHAIIPGLTAKVDVTFMYSTDNFIGGGDITFTAFKYNENSELVKDNLIFDRGKVIIEYINGIVRIFPMSNDINECILSDVVITYGNLIK